MYAYIYKQELSPFPKNELRKEIEKYQQASEFVWCQEEPQNAGAYAFMSPRLNQLIPEGKVSFLVK